MNKKNIFKTLFAAALIIITAACTDEDPLPKVSASDVNATIAENPPIGYVVGQSDVSVSFADNSNLNYYFTGTEELTNHISIDAWTGQITITNPDFFDYEQRTTATAQAAVEAYNSNDDMAKGTFTITITITDILETVPTLTTSSVTQITSSYALSGGAVLTDGNGFVTERGIVWSSVNSQPTINDSKQSSGSGLGSFEALLNSLSSNTTYYVRAYATNIYGTGYGNVQTFVTNVKAGDSYQGGIVAYVLQSGDAGYDVNNQHGIIAAIADQSTSAPWSLTLTTTGATSQAIGSGQGNTNTIVSNQGSGTYAAKICADLVTGGYDDWYLPSLYELNKLYLNRELIGGFAVAFYWSSSEDYINGAWLHSFNSNSQTVGTKSNSYYVRAVRSF